MFFVFSSSITDLFRILQTGGGTQFGGRGVPVRGNGLPENGTRSTGAVGSVVHGSGGECVARRFASVR